MRLSSLMLVAVASMFIVINPAFANETAASGALNLGPLALGLAVMGGAFGQGKIISAAVESISRNPGAAGQMFLPWLLGLVLIESLVILMFLVGAGLI